MDPSNATSTIAKAAASGADADSDSVPLPQLKAAAKPVPAKVEQLSAAAADPASASATTSTEFAESGGGEDEQVEKFYTLLANIRAMRSMHGRGSGDADTSTEGAASVSEVCGGVRKRARWAEQPWRPSFRMEDFKEAPGGSATRKHTKDDGAATNRRPGTDTTDEAAEDEGDDV